MRRGGGDLTASRFGEISSITERRNIEKLCDSLYGVKEIHSEAMAHGMIHEPLALEHLQTV